jgi:hypothetical protein
MWFCALGLEDLFQLGDNVLKIEHYGCQNKSLLEEGA